MVRVLVLAALVLVACKQKESSPAEAKPAEAKPAATMPSSKVGTTLTPGSMKRAHVEISYAVALPAGADVDSLEKLARAKDGNVELARVSLADMFNDEQIAFMTKTLPQADVEALRTASVVIRLRVAGRGGIALARELAEVTRDVADAAHGLVLDPEALKIYPAAAFHDHVPGDHPDVRNVDHGAQHRWW